MEGLAGYEGDYNRTTKEQLDLQEKLNEEAKKYNAAMSTISQNIRDMNTAFGALLAMGLTPFFQKLADLTGSMKTGVEAIFLKFKQAEEDRVKRMNEDRVKRGLPPVSPENPVTNSEQRRSGSRFRRQLAPPSGEAGDAGFDDNGVNVIGGAGIDLRDETVRLSH